MKKVISLFLAIAIICTVSVVAFANMFEGSYVMSGSADTTKALSAGDTFSYSLYISEVGQENLTIACNNGSWNITLGYDSSAFELVEAPTLNYNYTIDSTLSTDGDGYYWASITSTDAETVFTKDVAWITYKFKVKDTATEGAKEFTLNNLAIFDDTDFTELNYGEATSGDLTPSLASVTIAGGGEEEEEFDLSYEGVKAEDGTVSEGFASGSKVATVFAKNETGSELAAESYGIVFGGQKYVGAAPVAAGKYWVIKLYDPTSTILVGTSYKYQTFTGDSYSVEQTYTFN